MYRIRNFSIKQSGKLLFLAFNGERVTLNEKTSTLFSADTYVILVFAKTRSLHPLNLAGKLLTDTQTSDHRTARGLRPREKAAHWNILVRKTLFSSSSFRNSFKMIKFASHKVP